MKTEQCPKDLAVSCHLSNLCCAFSLASILLEFFDKQVHGLMSGCGAAFKVEGKASFYIRSEKKQVSFTFRRSIQA